MAPRPVTWTFSATCPRGHHATQDGFTREQLRLCLAADVVIRLYCVECDGLWTATEPQRRAIGWALEHAA